MELPVFTTAAAMRAHLLPFRRADKRIALVPTMGALHEGHLSLIRAAADAGDHVVVWIFVNPAQFAPNEDFQSYPRDLDSDCAKISSLNLSSVSVFAPEVHEIYPDHPQPIKTQIALGEIASRWEGAARPTHFSGVALVVTKFFDILQPDLAFFGEKDFQQLQVIRQLVRDLSMPVEIMGVETVRESTGLALSSRNVYLSEKERNQIAPQLFAALADAAAGIAQGAAPDKILSAAIEKLKAGGFDHVDYFAYVSNEMLQPLNQYQKQGSRIVAAVRLGKTRLIDNIKVS